MKINAVNNYIFNTSPSHKTINQVNQNIQNQQFDCSLLEVLGRSQVNFTGNKYQQYDRMFIDTLAQNLRLSDDNKTRVANDLNKFLRINHLNSLEDIANEYEIEKQIEFIGILIDRVCNSDFDNIIIAKTLGERMAYNGEYKPVPDLYAKDYEVVDHILNKYDYDKEKKAEIFDVMKMEAERCNYRDVFEIFKSENNPNRFQYLLNNYLNVDADASVDLIIDFNSMAYKTETERRADIYPWKLSSKMGEQVKDTIIAHEIITGCDLVQGNSIEDMKKIKPIVKDITNQLDKRRSGISVEQISYELVEKYNLPLDGYDFIKNLIYKYDTGEILEN